MTATHDGYEIVPDGIGPPAAHGHIVVIGGGTMGAGLAQSLLQADYQVHVIEPDPMAATRAYDRVRSGLERAHRRHPSPDASVERDLRRLTTGTTYDADLDIGLVIEAVPEIAGPKSTVLSRASATWREAVIATNTSSMSITELAASVRDPSRFIGTHFFNPVPRSKLVEIVVGPSTADNTIEAACDMVRRLGKEFIQVRDVPGFATSRLGIILGVEAIRMVEERVASPRDIDKGMRLGYGLPMGPLELTDLVGLDVRLLVAEYLANTFGPRFEPPQLLRDKVARGELGTKVGQGFYRWENGRQMLTTIESDRVEES